MSDTDNHFEVKCNSCGSTDVYVIGQECGTSVEFSCSKCGAEYETHTGHFTPGKEVK
jgi:transposase-like protein